MSLAENPPPPLGPEWKPWGERLVSFLARTKTKLAYYIAGDTAAEDGVVLWDRTGYPVVSKNGEFRQIVLADGYGDFSATADITAVAPNTAYSIAFTSVTANGGISINPSDNTKIMFAEAGVYTIAGHVQLQSSSASAKTFYYWISVNGVDTDHSERVSLSSNGFFHVMAVSDQVNLPANAYVQVKWAVSDVNIILAADPATAFAPASEPIHLTITRSRQ